MVLDFHSFLSTALPSSNPEVEKLYDEFIDLKNMVVEEVGLNKAVLSTNDNGIIEQISFGIC